MKVLVAFYSNTGRTQAKMVRLMEKLGGERLITIRTPRPRTGPIGFLKSGFEAVRRRAAVIEPLGAPLDMADFDLVVLGSPVWAGHLSSPMRAFLQQNGQGIRRCAYVLTHGGPETFDAVLDELDALTGVKRTAALSLGRDTAATDEALDQFAASLLESAR